MHQPYQLILVHSRGTHAHESPRRALVLLPIGADIAAACHLPAVVAFVEQPTAMFVFPLLLHPDDALQVGEWWVYRGMG